MIELVKADDACEQAAVQLQNVVDFLMRSWRLLVHFCSSHYSGFKIYERSWWFFNGPASTSNALLIRFIKRFRVMVVRDDQQGT